MKGKILCTLSLIGWLMSGCDSQNKSATNEGTTAVENQSSDTKQDQKEVPVILFFGNSITAGYQLDVEDAFPALIQDRLDSLGYEFKVINAGLSGETTSGGLNRIEWVLQTIPDVFVLELGANDGLRGLDLDETKKNLLLIIDKVKEANPEVKILLVGMRVPPNLGKDYTTRFSAIFPAVASETGASLLPFILDGVAGNPELNLPDGIHPTVEGHQILAENVWRALRPILEEFQTL